MRFLILFIGLLISVSTLFAQKDTSDLTFKGLNLKLNQGYILVHSKEVRSIRNSYPTGITLDFFWHQASQKAWASCNCYPKLGIATSFWTFDQAEILGYGAIALFYVEPVFGAHNRMSFSLRAGTGLSYQTKPYDEVSNPKNQSYSTRVAFPLQLGGSLNYRLNTKWYIHLSAIYNHISNAGFKEPNKGINWPTAAIGVSRYFTEAQFLKREKLDWRAQGKPVSRLDVTLFMGINEPQKRLFLMNPGIEVKYSRQFGRLSAFSVGAEWLYDNGARFEMEQNSRSDDPQRGGLAIGHEFLLGRFIFSQQLGVYLYKPYRVGDPVYQRYGLVYKATEALSLGMNLKVHRHVSDFVDFRLGWSFEL